MNRLYILSLLLLLHIAAATAQTITSAAQLMLRGDSLEQSGDLSGALAAFLLAKEAYVQEGKQGTADEAQCLHNIGKVYCGLNELDNARKYDLAAMEMRKRLFGEASEGYITTLNNYALTYCWGGDNVEAQRLQKRVMELCDQLPHTHAKYALFAINMGRYCYINGDTAQAMAWWEKALPFTEKFSESYEFLLEQLGLYYIGQNDYANSMRIMALTEEHNTHELTKVCDTPKCLMERAQYYADTGENTMARESYQQLMALQMDSATAVKACEAYAKFLGMQMNDYSSGADYMRRAATLATDGQQRTTLLHKAGLYCYIGKRYADAVECYTAVIAFYKDNAAAQRNIASVNVDLGNAYYAMKQHDNAALCFAQAVAYYEQAEPRSEKHAKALERLAVAEKFGKHYDEAIGHYKQAIDIFNALGQADAAADAANRLTLCYTYAGRTPDSEYDTTAADSQRKAKTDKIIKETIGQLETTRQYLGQTAYASSLGVIAGGYALNEDYANSVAYYEQYIDALRTAVRGEFRMLDEKGRSLFWKEHRDNLDEMLDMYCNMPVGQEVNHTRMAPLAYDAALLSKGILLNSSIEFERVLKDKGDKVLLDKYNMMLTNSQRLDSLRLTSATENSLTDIIRLQEQNEALQLEVYKGCAEFADFTNYISYTWRDVQQILTSDDIAIEFCVMGLGLDNYKMLIALTLTNDMPQPVAVPVCNMAELRQIAQADDFFSNSALTQVLWQALNAYGSGKRRVFFSPDGLLNQLAIEYMSLDGQPLSEQMEVYRLSSTKQICYQSNPLPTTQAALFGDIAYDDTPTVVANVAQQTIISTAHQSVADTTHQAVGNKREAIGYPELTHTREEVTAIQSLLASNTASVATLLLRTDASEAAFRSLDGTETNILHIATHGKFQAQQAGTDSDAMVGSILAFAGANLGEGPEEQDGIVSAADVAHMNLRHCTLAVLSACETGLGRLGDDGVFGLQRGFKNAGVRTLLMSLHSVDDAVTTQLMIAFYRHYTAGLTKREALTRAQQDVRAAGHTDPLLWASFILLDAVE